MTAKSNNAPITSGIQYAIHSDEIQGQVSKLSLEVNVAGQEVVTIIPSGASTQAWMLTRDHERPELYRIQASDGSVNTYLMVQGNLVTVALSPGVAALWKITGEIDTMVEVELAYPQPENHSLLTAPSNSGEPVTTSTRRPSGNSQKWKFSTNVGDIH